MKLKIKPLQFEAGRPVAILNQETAKELNIHLEDRVLIEKEKRLVVAVVDIAKGLIKKNQIAVSQEVLKDLKTKQGEKVEVKLTFHPESIEYIHKKLDCKTLSKKELGKIIEDIVENALTEAEIAYFISGVYKCGMSIKETENLIKAIVDTGKKLKLKGKIADKHSIGGVPGNRTTPIVVSICSAAGLKMPKTSSRAITSAAGTADTIESIAGVEFSVPEIYKIVKKTNACMVWGGALGLAPADDRIIQIEKLINLDPEPQLLASILGKKLAVGSKYILIDIPYGKSAKVSRKKALHLKRKFEKISKDFKIKLKCILTDGSQPIGKGVGPVLEIKDVVSVLQQKKARTIDLEKKSLKLSGLLLEIAGKAKKGEGRKKAKKILNSGKAFKQFKKIIKAQGGDLNFKKLKPGKFSHNILANKKGKISHMDNKKINLLARILGCPADKKAGIYLYKNKDEEIKKREKILTLYSQSEEKLKQAIKYCKNEEIFIIR